MLFSGTKCLKNLPNVVLPKNIYKKVYLLYIMADEIPHCNSCNLNFKNNACYKKHLKTSRHIQRSTNPDIIILSCTCGRTYSYNQSLYVHQKKCEQYKDSKTQNIQKTPLKVSLVQQLQTEKNEMREKLISFEKEHEEMKAQIALLLDKHAGSTTNNNTTNNNNIETQNVHIININAFGNENTDYLDDKAILACIGRVYKSIPSLLEKIHFDPKHPENHNIKITNKKLPYASVMGNNQKWKTVDRKDAIDTMVNNGYNMLDEKYKENKDKLPTSKQEHFKGFQSKFATEDKDLLKEIKAEVDMMVLNGIN
jgi:hypothetical protein